MQIDYKNLPMPARIFAGVVLIPTLLVTFYYGLLASDIYISEARYALRMNAELPSIGLFESVLGGGGNLESASEDASIVREYILSRNMIEQLDTRLGIRGHYSSGDVDFLARLDPDASLEEFLVYYRGMVDIGIDNTTHVSTVRVRAFTPEMSRDIARTIIELSEELVNTLSSRIVEDSLQFARDEVGMAESRVREASMALTRFRTDSNTINPGEETSAVLGIVTELETQLATTRAQLLEAQGYMKSDSPQVRVLKVKVAALEAQIEEVRKRLSNKEEASTDYTRLIDSYEPLLLEQELATKQYASTLASLEVARIEAQRKQRYLLPFVTPMAPDEAVEPDRLHAILTTFVILSMIYAIGALVWAAIKDHMRI